MPDFTLNVNGIKRTVDVEGDTPLLWVLRDNLQLTGTKYSCGVGICGTCVVHINGQADYGIVFNPDTVEAQMESAIIFAISAALKGEMIIRNGGIVNTSYDDYPILEYSETPEIETYIVQNDLPVGGVGEVGIAAATPALINAIFNAAGKRVRKLPVRLT